MVYDIWYILFDPWLGGYGHYFGREDVQPPIDNKDAKDSVTANSVKSKFSGRPLINLYYLSTKLLKKISRLL